MSKDETTSMEATTNVYQSHIDGRAAVNEAKTEEAEKAREESGIVSVDTPLDETQRFVANPDDLRKDVSSEEEFSEGLTDGDDDLEGTSDEKPAAKKTASKKG